MRRAAAALLAALALPAAASAQDPAARAEDPVATDLAARLDAYFAPLAAAGEFGGVVLVGDADSIRALRVYGQADHELDVPVAPDTRFRIASLTKTLTAAAVLVLGDRGALDLDDPLARWIPDFPGGGEITIRHLLRHESGVGDPDPERAVTGLEELVAAIADAPPHFEPGTANRYSNAGYALLARVVERASGTAFDVFLRRTFFEPLGMAGTGAHGPWSIVEGAAEGYLPGPPPAGVARAPRPDPATAIGSGHLWSSGEDLWRWARAVDARAIHDAEAGDWPYGWGKIRTEGREGLEQTGLTDGFTASLIVHRSTGTYVVVLGNVMNAAWTTWARDASAIAHGERVAPALPPPPVAVDPARLRDRAGTYVSVDPGPPAVEVVLREQHLWLQWEGRPPGHWLAPLSAAEFGVRGECGTVRFAGGDGEELRWACGESTTVFRRVERTADAGQPAHERLQRGGMDAR